MVIFLDDPGRAAREPPVPRAQCPQLSGSLGHWGVRSDGARPQDSLEQRTQERGPGLKLVAAWCTIGHKGVNRSYIGIMGTRRYRVVLALLSRLHHEKVSVFRLSYGPDCSALAITSSLMLAAQSRMRKWFCRDVLRGRVRFSSVPSIPGGTLLPRLHTVSASHLLSELHQSRSPQLGFTPPFTRTVKRGTRRPSLVLCVRGA